MILLTLLVLLLALQSCEPHALRASCSRSFLLAAALLDAGPALEPVARLTNM
jgi:hypothetical protein